MILGLQNVKEILEDQYTRFLLSHIPEELVVTSAMRKSSNERSVHPLGLAVDIRSWNFKILDEEKYHIASVVNEILGPGWDFIYENDTDDRTQHFHFERDIGKESREAGYV